MRRLLLCVVIAMVLTMMTGCSNEKTKYEAFEASYSAAMGELTQFTDYMEQGAGGIKSPEQLDNIVGRCDVAGKAIKENALLLLEKANALKNEEVRKSAVDVASQLTNASKSIEKLQYACIVLKGLAGAPSADYNNVAAKCNVFGGEIMQAKTDIENTHAALKGTISR